MSSVAPSVVDVVDTLLPDRVTSPRRHGSCWRSWPTTSAKRSGGTCAALLSGADPHGYETALRYLAGRPAAPFLAGTWGPAYWSRVWGARGLLYVWNDDAARRWSPGCLTRRGGWLRCASRWLQSGRSRLPAMERSDWPHTSCRECAEPHCARSDESVTASTSVRCAPPATTQMPRPGGTPTEPSPG